MTHNSALENLEEQIKRAEDDKAALEELWRAEAQRELDEMADALGLPHG